MEEKQLSEIGSRIAKLRKLNHITQEQLAEELDVSPKHISHVERGKSCLSLKQLINVCRILHASMDYIVMGSSEDPIAGQLPEEMLHILYSDDQAAKNRLRRYFDMYIELLHGGA